MNEVNISIKAEPSQERLLARIGYRNIQSLGNKESAAFIEETGSRM
jgi:hypothetical protein